MINDIATALIVALVAIGLVIIPVTLWFGLVALSAWIIGMVYSAGLQSIIDGPTITFVQMFCLIWVISFIGNLFRRG